MRGSAQPPALPLRWRPGFAQLGEAFFTRLPPQPLPDPYWVGRSAAMARELGLPDNWWQAPDALPALAGNLVLPGSQHSRKPAVMRRPKTQGAKA